MVFRGSNTKKIGTSLQAVPSFLKKCKMPPKGHPPKKKSHISGWRTHLKFPLHPSPNLQGKMQMTWVRITSYWRDILQPGLSRSRSSIARSLDNANWGRSKLICIRFGNPASNPPPHTPKSLKIMANMSCKFHGKTVFRLYLTSSNPSLVLSRKFAFLRYQIWCVCL